MGGELVSDPPAPSAKPITMTEQFCEAFPYYLSIGMSPDQFWDRDCTLVVAFRKAEKIRLQKQNQMLWLQGMYVYEALCDASPIFRDFAKKGTKPLPFRDEPYPLFRDERERKEEKREQAAFAKSRRYMEQFMTRHNRKHQPVEP